MCYEYKIICESEKLKISYDIFYYLTALR